MQPMIVTPLSNTHSTELQESLAWSCYRCIALKVLLLRLHFAFRHCCLRLQSSNDVQTYTVYLSMLQNSGSQTLLQLDTQT